MWLVVAAVASAAIIGEQFGPAIFERRESGLFSRTSVKRTQSFFDRYGRASILLARFVPVVRAFAPLAAGVGRMRVGIFTLFNIIGATTWSAIIIGVGFTLGRVQWIATFILNDLDLILLAVVVVSMAPLIIRALVVRARRRVEAATARPPTAP